MNSPIAEPTELQEIPEFIKVLQQISIDSIKITPPDEVEIKNVLKRLKNGKSANDIPAEFFKYAKESPELIAEMMKLFSIIWETHEIPQSFKHSLWKGTSKGSPKDPKTYRGLQVGSSLCKIMIITILDRLKMWYDEQLLDNQNGFRSGRGTADGIYITKRVQQITDQMEKPAYILFVDLTAAFDHVVRSWLFTSIYQRFPPGADINLIKILEARYEHLTTSLNETPEDIIELILGVRQGGPESPPLYNLFMDCHENIYASVQRRMYQIHHTEISNTCHCYSQRRMQSEDLQRRVYHRLECR